jgi:hypothetical protein
LAGAGAMLRTRLVRRGVAVSMLGILLTAANLEAAVPPALEPATAQGGCAIAGKTVLNCHEEASRAR